MVCPGLKQDIPGDLMLQLTAFNESTADFELERRVVVWYQSQVTIPRLNLWLSATAVEAFLAEVTQWRGANGAKRPLRSL